MKENWIASRAAQWIVVSVLFLLGAIPVPAARPHHDVACLLALAENFVDGDELYVHVVDHNPPLIFVLGSIPVLLARVLGTSPLAAFDALVLALAAISLLLCGRVLRPGGLAADRLGRTSLLAVLAVVSLSVAGDDFGQREHLFVLLALPYLLISLLRSNDAPVTRGLAITAGVFAAVGFALKPFFLLVLAAVELYLIAHRRGWTHRRPEAIAIVAVQILCVTLIFLFTPRYFEVARLAVDVYSAYNVPVAFILDRTLIDGKVTLFALAALLVVRPTGRMLHPRQLLLVLMLAAIGIVWIQMKAFPYHYYPARAVGALALGVVAVSLLERRQEVTGVFRAGTVGLTWGTLVVLASVALLRVQAVAHSEWRDDPLIDLIGKLARGRSVAALSTSIPPAFPAVTIAGARWGIRYTCLWPLPAFYRSADPRWVPVYHSPEGQTRAEREFIDAIVEDFRRNEPVLVMVDRSPVKQSMGSIPFDYLEYFRQDERFAQLWKQYVQMDVPLPRLSLYIHRGSAAMEMGPGPPAGVDPRPSASK